MEEKLRKHIERRVPLTDEEFAFILTHFTVKRFKKHQFLIQEAQSVPEMFFVVSGLIKLVFTNASDKQHILSFAMEDWWECDFQAFFEQANATLAIDCLEETVVYCLSLAGYQALCDSSPSMVRFFLISSTRSHAALQRRLLLLMTAQVKERYEQLRKQYPSLIQRVPKKMLASYLGVSRETLSRLSVSV